mmetsp:Transcript_38177/g.59643  ORF Transcript_38177/g.59643 Transcript_38177/m.59643 type:complete len:253 (+) Transcript_38177:80-838(+)
MCGKRGGRWPAAASQGSVSRVNASGRSSGWRWKHRAQKARAGAEYCGGGSGHLVPCMASNMAAKWLSKPFQGGSPVETSTTVQARLHTSALKYPVSDTSCWITSGAIHSGVPLRLLVVRAVPTVPIVWSSRPTVDPLAWLPELWVRRNLRSSGVSGSSIILEVPKSANLIVPSDATRALEALMSRCAMRFPCRKVRPSSSCQVYCTATLSSSGPNRSTSPASDPPGTYSSMMHMNSSAPRSAASIVNMSVPR